MSASESRLRTLSAIKLALLARQERESGAREDPLEAEPIAVVGMGCRFPGGADNPAAYWRLLADGVDAISEVPADRWDWRSLLDADPAAPGKITSRWGGFLASVDGFDASFFGISPREALHIDPQQRLFLEVAYEALEDAGFVREQLAGARVGVFAASYHNDYAQSVYGDRRLIGAHTVTGASHSVLPNRLSYLLDLRGPSISIDTACSSSLVALHLASRSLRRGESDIAISGGVSLILTPELSIALSKWGFLAEDGRCKTFDARANGFVRGEGCGVVALKRLSDALADNDRVLALIRGTAVNQDGRTTVLTAPSGLAQQAVVRDALADGSLTADDISYVEAHGTGTSLGDPIELEALAAVIGTRAADRRVVVASAKTNIGHLEAAAGIAGVIKVIMAMREGAIPPHLHFRTPNPHFDLASSPFRIPTALEPWPVTTEPRRAGVSSFGFGGTNAHVVLEEAPALAGTPAAHATAPFVLPISAQSPDALAELARRHEALLSGTDTVGAGDVCFTAGKYRDHHDHRIAVIGDSAAELGAGLQSLARGETVPSVTSGSRGPGDRAAAVFVYSGQGTQWCGMGQDLLRDEPAFSDAVAACDAAMRPLAAWRLLEELQVGEDRSRLDQTEIAQPALFAMQVGLTALWREWGVEPAAVVGHSVGEIAAAHAAGILDLESAARLAVVRGRIMQAATGLGRMAAIETDARDGERIVADSSGLLSLAAVNGPNSIVLSGDRGALDRALVSLSTRGIGHKMLPVNYAFHSAQMEPFRTELERALGTVRPGRGSVAFYSTVTGSLCDPAELVAEYWGRNIRQQVRFAQAIAAAAADDLRIFLEVSPNPALQWNIDAILAPLGGGRVATSLRRGRTARSTLVAGAAQLYAGGVAVRWDTVQPHGRHVDVPFYPWQRKRFWVSPRPAGADADSLRSAHRILGTRLDSPALSAPVYESVIRADTPAFLADHAIAGANVLPAAAIIDMVLAAACDGAGDGPVRIEDLVLLSPVSLDRGSTRLQTVFDSNRTNEFTVFSRADDDGASEWVRRATGHIGSAPANAGADHAPPGAARARCTEALDRNDVYAKLEQAGLDFGPAFRGITTVQFGAGEAVATVTLPIEATELGADFRFHPALLDACIQPSTILCRRAIVGKNADGEVFIPFGVESFESFKTPSGLVQSCVRLRATDDKNASCVLDIEIFGEDDTIVASMRGLRLRRVPIATFAAHEHGRLYEERWADARFSTPATSLARTRWLLCADADGLADATADHLGAARATCVTIPSSADAAAMARDVANELAGGKLNGIVHFRSLDGPPIAAASDERAVRDATQRATGTTLSLVQAICSSNATDTPLWIVTRAARAVRAGDMVDATQAGSIGIARAAMLEYPELVCRCVDLDATRTDADLSQLADELARPSDPENECGWRSGHRSAPRLTRVEGSNRTLHMEAPWRLENLRTGALDGVAPLPAERRAPGEGEVEIEVRAAGLNFRDVLNALGMYPGRAGALGGECAGIVRRVGRGVAGIVAGDEVMAFAQGTFASHVLVKASHATARPATLTVAEAASTPVAFLTALYALERLAKVRAGERVLIHAAAGGVGLAAVQVALRNGVEVFATAGSRAKRDFLRQLGIRHVLDSRTVTFADEISEFTRGVGVNVVLNALAGDFIPASVRALAHGGRFIEMGKREIWSADAMSRERPDVGYFPFDLGDAADGDHTLIPSLFAELKAHFGTGDLRPLPVVAFEMAAAPDAFRMMAQARHIGKVVLSVPRSNAAAPVASNTYLVTGGLGAIGIRVARWLADRGAKHLVLASRHAPTPAAESVVDELRSRGIDVRVAQADVSDAQAVAALIAGIAGSGAPLRGVVHSAGVLDDGIVLDLNWERVAKVMDPKFVAAWQLHTLTRTLDLDFFVLFSAGAAVLGSPGQSGYCAANATLDAFASARRNMGLEATSIAWGPWADAGMAAELTERDAMRWRARGVAELPTAAALEMMAAAIEGRAASVAALDVNWTQFAGAAGLPPRFSRLAAMRHAPTRSMPSVPERALVAQLNAAPATDRRSVLMSFLREHAHLALGLDASIRIDDRRPLKELGLDSLMAVELRNAFVRSAGTPLPATLLFDYPTLEALANHLSVVLQLEIAPIGVNRKASASVVGVATLTDDEAEAELLAELERGAPRVRP